MTDRSWFRTYLPRPRATAQLICFPHAGGTATAFRGWAELLPPSIELVAVQYPGRQDRVDDPMPPDIGVLADRIAAELAPRLDRRTAFFGHSMGATVAYEVARRLRPRYPSPLARLFVSASDAPPAHRRRGLDAGDEQIRGYVSALGALGAAALAQEDLWQLALPALRHDFGLIENYRYVPGAPLSCPVTAIAGERDAAVTAADMGRWAELSIGRFDSHVLPGGHFYFDHALPELVRLLGGWETAEEPDGMLIPELVARQAAATPRAVAVADGAGELTYAELDRAANQLAHLLAGAGAGPGRPVAIQMERSRRLVVALLAAWRAGAPYVPLDPAGPAGRTATMLADSGAVVVLTDGPAKVGGSGTAGAPGCTPLPLDAELTVLRPYQATGPVVAVTGQHSAYALYTSGTTGTPKAVVVDHAGIGNYVRWRVRNHHLSAADRVLQKTALTFDAAAWEVFAPLVSGGTVALAPTGVERDPAALVRATAAAGATVLQVVPSVLRALVDEPGWERCTALRILSSAGEPLHAELAQRFLRAVEPAAGDVEVWNTYGPTECSIDVTAHRFDPLQRSGPVAIGTAIDGMRVVVGADGELLVGGPGVAQGYLGRPALTAERFVPDPAGGRLYRTGDRARLRADGTLEYLGRVDSQVKINGVRIEPDEVAAVLVTHPGVRQAAVTSYRAANGSARLAAYVRMRAGGGTLAELTAYLRERLPEGHVPAAFVELAQFPTTAGGKVDLRALPAPDPAAESTVDGAAEELVARAWREVLGVERVGRDDDFFRLGGSSLQLARLANRLRSASGRPVELSRLLSARTVATQARLVDPGPEEQAAPAGPEIGAEIGPAPAVARTGPPPMSFGQHRLWLQDRLEPASREWVTGLFLRVPPGVAESSVRSALDALLARHETLRTRFEVRAGEPVQHVDPPAPMELRVLDTAGDRIGAALDEDAARGFDLERGPLARALLFGEPGGARTLVVLVHHIACDGWSSAVLEREFRQLLAGASLPPLPVRYADYAVWQRDQLTDDVLAAELTYWRNALAGAAPLSLPADRPRPRRRDARGAVVPFTIPAPLAGALDELGRRAGATPFMTLLTAYAALLARHTGRWDVPIGAPVAGRDRPELEGVVGFFLNSLVLRCRLGGDRGFEQALAGVRDVCTEALMHQRLPFDRLVAELAPQRDPSRTPLYQVAFDFHGAELTGAPDDPADLASMIEASGVAKTDLTLYVRRRPDGSLLGLFEYATALYDHATVERLARHFRLLLESVTAAPQARLDTVDLLPPDERELLAGWAATPAPPVTTSVPELIARHSGPAPALVAGTQTVSFAELHHRADRLAERLRSLAVGPESVVGVLLDRGVRLPVALLATWKAGAAYLPLDPDIPVRRAVDVLADAEARVLVTSPAQRDRLGGAFAGSVLLADEAPDTAAVPRPPSDPAGPADLDQLAYVIYTSGSTGRPKGVAITHRGLANHLRWAAAELAGRGTGGAPLFSSVAFDLVVPNLWAPLVAGQPVHLLPVDLDLTELGGRLSAAAPYAFVKLTPGHLEVLSHQLGPDQVAALAGVVVVAGEALPPASADRWATDLGPGRLVNEYGPTEASVGATTYPVVAPVGRDRVPIGRALPGTSVRVLDELLGPVPVGAVGEVHVGGAGVARGYVGRPALTADHFRPDPYGPPGARVYRTGDLALVLPSGDIDFLGRRDEQVQLSGYRVEPGEVAAVLREHPDVHDAVVVVAGGTLVAHCVTGLAPAALTEHCAQRLPAYLVPGAFVRLDAIPLTANGKVDRAALPPAAAVSDPAAPRGILEERIAAIFTELLDAPAGAHSDFLASGGNSLQAIRLIAAIQSEFEVSLPMRAVFEAGTVAGLAAAVEAELRAEVDRMSEDELVVATRQAQEAG